MKTLLDQEREKSDKVFFVSAGDLFSGKTGIYQINDSISHLEIRDYENLEIFKDLLNIHE